MKRPRAGGGSGRSRLRRTIDRFDSVFSQEFTEFSPALGIADKGCLCNDASTRNSKGFLTISANETRSPHLLRTLHRLFDEYKNLGDEVPVNEIFQKLDNHKRAHLVAEDPVVCAVILYRIVTVLMCSKLCAKRKNNPFGRYRVEDYFIRIEFHHRGSPHVVYVTRV